MNNNCRMIAAFLLVGFSGFACATKEFSYEEEFSYEKECKKINNMKPKTEQDKNYQKAMLNYFSETASLPPELGFFTEAVIKGFEELIKKNPEKFLKTDWKRSRYEGRLIDKP